MLRQKGARHAGFRSRFSESTPSMSSAGCGFVGVLAGEVVLEAPGAGRTHYGRVWRWEGPSPSTLRSDLELARRYAVGQPLQVAYRPDNPDVAVLEPGVSSDACWIPALGEFLLLAGLATGLFAIPDPARIHVPIAPEAEEWLRRTGESENQRNAEGRSNTRNHGHADALRTELARRGLLGIHFAEAHR